MKISFSLLREIQKNDHCPKQIYYAFVEDKELIEPSENMLLGRYFESELLGSCRGGEKQDAKLQKNGFKYKIYSDVDDNIEFAKSVFKKIGLDINKGKSQLSLESNFLRASIDHQNRCLKDKNRMANYDLKWTATKEDDVWNGWGDPESKDECKLQSTHYTLVDYELTGEWKPFYFLVFGKTNWVKILNFQITDEAIDVHKQLIASASSIIRKYADEDYKGNGSFNKCEGCPFKEFCPDRAKKPEIEVIII